MSEEKLKPCPFCGGKADVWTDPFFRVWKVFCTECGANILSNTDENADVLWNRRVASDTQMKCDRCNGQGFSVIAKWKCPVCDGKGVVEPLTNEEWRKTCSTEEFAEFINLIIRVGPYENEPKDFWEHVYGRGGEHGAKSIVEWLKKPHTPKE